MIDQKQPLLGKTTFYMNVQNRNFRLLDRFLSPTTSSQRF